jgi:hypothetical protein
MASWVVVWYDLPYEVNTALLLVLASRKPLTDLQEIGFLRAIRQFGDQLRRHAPHRRAIVIRGLKYGTRYWQHYNSQTIEYSQRQSASVSLVCLGEITIYDCLIHWEFSADFGWKNTIGLNATIERVRVDVVRDDSLVCSNCFSERIRDLRHFWIGYRGIRG